MVKTSTDCPIGMKIEKEFELNMGELKQVCPAMFHNAYPVIVSRLHGAPFPWQELTNNRGVLQCPDSISSITLIFREKEHD